MDWTSLYHTLKCLNWVILFILASLSTFIMPPAFTTGVIAGGFLVMVNLHVLQHTIIQAFSPDEGSFFKKAPVILKYYLRLAGMAVLIYVLLGRSWIHPIGLTLGLSIVVIGIAFLGIQLSRKIYSQETA